LEYTSARAARQLIDKGYTRVYALEGGWQAWFRAKYPVEPK
jgi:rhodanese-related sulfurtransferase